MASNIFPFLSDRNGRTVLFAHIQPRASRNGIAGVFQNRLKIRICSPPVEGEANRECIEFLSRTLGISKSEIILEKGAQGRQKTFLISRPLEFVQTALEAAGLTG